MNFDTIEDILTFAIDKEKEAIAFYENLSNAEPSGGTKQVFQDFAEEEKKHRSLLEGFLKKDTTLAEYRYKWVPDLKISDYLVDVEYREGMQYTEVLRLAMKREEKSLALYNDLSSKTDAPDSENLFRMLSQEEAKHKLALETLYDDYLAKQGG